MTVDPIYRQGQVICTAVLSVPTSSPRLPGFCDIATLATPARSHALRQRFTAGVGAVPSRIWAGNDLPAGVALHLQYAPRHHPIFNTSGDRPAPGGYSFPSSQPVAPIPPRGLPGPDGPFYVTG